MMLRKVYLEITNQCNRSCAFCPGTVRSSCFMDMEHFKRAANEVKSVSDYVYFHVMGEPLSHPDLSKMLAYCHEISLKVILTTNGTLLKRQWDTLLSATALHKVNISLHSFEANDREEGDYFENCFAFAKQASEKGIISVLRLWNLDGEVPGLNQENDRILSKMKQTLGSEWTENSKGYRIAPKLFLEWGSRFTWPDLSLPEIRTNGTCYGLRDQVGILSNGTVVPCCLDKDGDIALGNVFEQSLVDILAGQRATKIREGFLCGVYHEELCKKCGYAGRFSTKSR